MNCIRALIVLSILLCPSLALAGAQWTVDAGKRKFDESTEIGRAMAICQEHRHFVPSTHPHGKVDIEYDAGWESCDAIHVEWLKGEEAARDKAKADKDAADLEAVKGISKKLPAPK